MTEVGSAPPWVEVTCQSEPEFPQMVCGPAAAEFHSLLYRSYPSEVFSVPSGALLHHAQPAGFGGGAVDGEPALGDGRGAWLGEDCGAEDEALGRRDAPGVAVPGSGPGVTVPGDGEDVTVPSNSSSARPCVASPGVAVPGDGLGVEVVTLRHPTASRATSTSTATFGDVIAGQAIVG